MKGHMLAKDTDFDAPEVDGEIARIQLVLQEMHSIEEVFAKLGEPNEETTIRYFRGETARSFKGFVYSGLSTAVRVVVIDYGPARRFGVSFLW